MGEKKGFWKKKKASLLVIELVELCGNGIVLGS